MTISRAKLINPDVTRWYHCISRCVRSAFLLADVGKDGKKFDRKAWLADRLRFLDQTFAVSVAGFAVLNNHLHTLLRIDAEESKRWSAEEVARRWFVLFPPRDKKRQQVLVTPEFIEAKIQNSDWVEKIRKRLTSISWFMKCLKEPLARLANKADGCKGTFFEGRFKSIAVLDQQSLLTVCAYIDLNPVAAKIASVPEESDHTSIKERVDHVASQGRLDDLRVAMHGSVAASKAASKLENDLWLIPIEDRRRIDSNREGMLSGFTLGNYLMLVEYMGRKVREGKASISSELKDIFERLGTTSEAWEKRLRKMNRERWFGSFIANSRQLLRETASMLGFHHLVNVSG